MTEPDGDSVTDCAGDIVWQYAAVGTPPPESISQLMLPDGDKNSCAVALAVALAELLGWAAELEATVGEAGEPVFAALLLGCVGDPVTAAGRLDDGAAVTDPFDAAGLAEPVHAAAQSARPRAEIPAKVRHATVRTERFGFGFTRAP
ncbi:MAG: hypothetical protein ACRDV3_02760 [Acidothermaceae bacterium]